MQDDFWIDVDINPPAPGWYAAYVITIGWPSDDDYPESDVSSDVTSSYWNGKEWGNSDVAKWGGAAGMTEDYALSLAKANDPDA